MSQDMFAQWREEDAANGNTVGQSVRPALEVAQDTTADAQAQNMQLAEQLGIPKEMVEEQSEWAKGEQKARQIEKNPLFAKWAEEDKTNAAFARDDTDAMSDVFEIMHEAELSAYGATGEQVKNDIVKGVLQYNAKRGDKEAQTQLMDMAGLTEDERQYGTISQTPMPGMIPQLGESFKEGYYQFGKNAIGFLAMLGENLQKDLISGRETGWAPFWKALAERSREALAYAEKNNSAPLNAEGFINDFVRNLPQVLLTAPVAMGAGAIGGAAFMGTNIAGGTYLDLTKKGVAPGTAAIAAFGNAAVQAPLEMLGFTKFFDIFKASGLGNFVKRVFESGATGYSTEFLQSIPDELSRIWAEGKQQGKSWEEIWKTFYERFPEIARQGAYEGLLALPLSILGGIGKFAADTNMAREARDWFVAQRAFHEKVEATKAKQSAPVLVQKALEEGGVTQEVRIPAKEIMRLHQEGVPVLDAMGWEEADVQTEAERGGDMTAKMSRLHAYLDAQAFTDVTQYARLADDSWSMADAEEYDSRVKEDADRLVAEQVSYAAEQNEIEQEQARIESELRETVSSIPGLRAAIRGGETLSDIDPQNRDSVDTVVSTQMQLINSIAQRLSSYGLPVAQFLKRIHLQGMMLDERGNLLTPEQYMQHMQELEEDEETRLRHEAEEPFWERVWGRLDKDSLRADFGEEISSLLYRHGRGLFAQKGEGVAVDELADELKTRGLLGEGTNDNDLVMKLLEMERPTWRRKGRRARQRMFQQATAEERLNAEAEAWEKTVDDFISGKLNPRRSVTILKNTPLVLSLLGADMNLPVSTDYAVLKKVLNEKHNLPEGVLKQLPKAMADPVMIFESATVKGDYVMMLELKDQDGATVVVPISFNYDSTGGYKVNYALSVYGQKDTATGRPRNSWFKKQIEEGRLRYFNNKKSRTWANSSGLHLPRVGTHPSNGKNKIYTEADLGKLKEQYPTFYQRDPETGIPENPFVALHNISADNLLRASALGGLPVPSIGITKADRAYTGFGEISLIGSRDMIDPQRTPVFSGDAYTARVPRPIWTSVKTPKVKELRKQVGKYFSAVNDDSALSAIVWKMTDDPNVDDAVRYFINSAGGRAAYLASQGADISSETEQTLKEKVSRDDPDFVRFAKEMIADKFDEPKIELGRKKVPMTLDNIVAAMISSQVKNKEKMMTFSDGVLNAATSVRIKDLEELDALRDRVTDEETAHARKSEQEALTSSYRDKVIKRYSGSSTWDALDDSMMALAEAAKKKGNTAKNIIAALKKKDFVDVTEEDVEDGVKAIQLMRDGLTAYFEAKPQRAVGLDEFKGAVVPENVDPEVLRVLEANGIPYQTYTTQDDRRSKVQSMSMELAMQTPGVLFQRAFHGTPFNFDKFTLDHIGAGEGAQAHGWGLYFAGKRKVSEGYREALASHMNKPLYKGEIISLSDDPKTPEEKGSQLIAMNIVNGAYSTAEEAKTFLLESAQEYLDYAEKTLKKTPDNALLQELAEQNRAAIEALNAVDINQFSVKKGGQLYEVEIPDNDVLLDEQKTYEEQPEKVKIALGKAVTDMRKRYGDDLVDKYFPKSFDGMTGKKIYEAFADMLLEPKWASIDLNAAGIKGITYEGGRDGRCFVVFDDKSIQILEKFYQFLGEQGAANLDAAEEVTTRMDNLVVAREMETAGKDANTIKRATGWERGADGLWRYETDDSTVALKGKLESQKAPRNIDDAIAALDDLDALVEQGYKKTKLSDVLQDDELFAAYPELKDLTVEIKDLGNYTRGAYTDATKTIELNSRLEGASAKATLLHEIQHAIQHIEGFASGGSPSMFENFDREVHLLQDVVNSWMKEAGINEFVRKSLADIRSGKKTMDQHWQDLNEFKKNSPYAEQIEASERSLKEFIDDYRKRYGNSRTPEEIYTRLMGEVEARNVSRRAEMDMDDRREFLASETEDVAREDQIFLENGLNAAMMSQERSFARGYVQIAQGQQYTIQLLKDANLSTLLHETGHIALLEMKSLMDMGVDNEALRTDYAKILDYLGITENDNLADTTDPRMVEANEKFAKAMELYLREGKAPSRNLESAFARIKRWLLRIYKQVINDPYFNGVELNDDIRAVFDRLLANENEIARASEKIGISDSMRAELDALGLTGNERARITSLIQEAQEQAADDLQKARDAHRMAQLREWKAQADEQMKKEPQYIALSMMRKNGIDMEAVRMIAGDEQQKKLSARLPGTKKSGDVASPDEIAWDAGYATPEEMISEVLAYPLQAERRRQIVAQKQAEHDANYSAEDYLFETEALAKSEEELGKKIADMLAKPRYDAELEGKTVGGEAVYPTEDQASDYREMAQYRASQEKLREMATESLRQTTMAKATDPEHFRRTVRRLIGEERRAIMRQDWQKALEANYQLRLNMELARMATQMRKRMDKFRGRLQTFCKKPENAPAARYAVARLGMPLGLVEPTSVVMRTAEGKTFNDIKEWASEVSAEYMDVQLNEGLYFVNAPGKNWREMTVEGFEDWFNEMTMLMTVETERRKISTAQGKMELAELGKEMAASIYEHGGTPDTTKVQQQKPWLHALKAFHAEHLKAGTIAMLADGDRRGIVYEHVVKPIDKAQYDEMNRMKAVDAKLKEIFDQRYSKDELSAMRQNKVLVQSLNGGKGEFITKENALAAFLNCGNESNYGRLMRGMEWNEQQLKDVLALLDERDFETAQMVWDYLETFRDESFAQEERLTGVKPTAIKAQPVMAPSGKVYRGGYYPVKYNSQKASRGTSPEDRMQGQGRAFPSVEHGSMKERVGGGLGAPLDLRLNVLPEHLQKTVHNLAFREPVVNVSKILREPSFKQAFTETAGIEQYRALQSWLNDVASEQNQDMGAMGKAASWARSHMALYTMGMKVSTMMAQLTGGLTSTLEIGPKWMATGTAKVFGHGRAGIVKAYQDALALSPMMQNRLTSFDREVAQSMNKLMDFGSTNKILDPVKRIDNWIKSHAYLPMGYFQMAVDLPTWHGAYEKAMAENGGDPQAAAEYADHIVEITQVGGATKDLAGIQRHGELAKLFTMYYSYFSCLYNISARRITMAARYRDLPHAMRLAGLSMLWFVEPVMSAILLNRGPDDDEDWAEWAAKEAIINPFSMIVGVRDIAKFEQDLLEGKNFGYRASPAFDLVASLGKAAAVPIETIFGDKDFDKKEAKKLAQGIGMASGTPLFGAQAITTLFNFWDVLDGSEELKLGDLLFTRRKNNSGGIWNRLGEAAGL